MAGQVLRATSILGEGQHTEFQLEQSLQEENDLVTNGIYWYVGQV